MLRRTEGFLYGRRGDLSAVPAGRALVSGTAAAGDEMDWIIHLVVIAEKEVGGRKRIRKECNLEILAGWIDYWRLWRRKERGG